MSRIPHKNQQHNINFALWMWTPNVREEGIGSMRTPADKAKGGSKIGKILRTSFMNGPQ